jgi:rRNA maturation endonuclease Nob1
MTLPKRKCATCGKTLIRKRRDSGHLERAVDFANRKYCNVACKAEAQKSIRDSKVEEPVPVQESRWAMRECLGYCGKKFMTVPERRICPACTRHQPREMIPEHGGPYVHH